MAQFRRITRSNPISNFRQVGPQGGTAFAVLAAAADEVYGRLAPAAMEKMKVSGEEEGRRLARSQIGSRPRAGSSYRDAIASIESAGSGGYKAVGPVTGKGHRAYGRYQVMDFNIGPWTEKYVGRRMTPEEFLADPAAQDAVFDGEFGSYVEKYGSPQEAASVWFSGRTMAQAGNASDGYTTVPQYVNKFNNALGAGGDATIVRTSEGKLEPRLFSPYSGEILQAHNIAAGIAYNAEMQEKGAVDLLSISQEFPLNPQGFESAAREYIDQVVSEAPDVFKPDLRGALEKEASRRFLGMVEEKHRDIRQRADNSSRALMDRWSTNYAEALAAGNQDEADAALEELQGILRARESLPGVAWTSEQSANTVLDAQRAAQRLVASQRSEISKEVKGQLDTIIKAAKAGLNGADEAILNDPLVQSLQPDLWAEATAFVTLRDNLPNFHKMTPAQQREALAQMREAPIARDFQVDVLGAAESAIKENEKAWEEDPIAHAATILEDKPPALPDFSLDTADAFIAALSARRAYALGLKEDGYVDFDAFLTNAEAESMGALFAKETPPEMRAAMAGAMVAGFGRDAVKVFDELKVDPVTRYAGKVMAAGGSPTLAREALVGQQMIAEGLVQLPSKAQSLASFAPNIMDALAGVPNPVKAQAEILPFAKALYAARGQAVQPDSDDAMALMKEAVNQALGGGVNKRGQATGGVQEVSGYPTLLPIGMTADQFREQIGIPDSGMFDRMFNAEIDLTGWTQATGKTPSWGGRPITGDLFANGRVRFVATGQNLYRMEVVSGSSVTDVVDEDGSVFFFDPMAF